MKGFLKWFTNESKMKRWILLILIGNVLALFGMVNLLIGKELNFGELAKIILSFVILIIIALVLSYYLSS